MVLFTYSMGTIKQCPVIPMPRNPFAPSSQEAKGGETIVIPHPRSWLDGCEESRQRLHRPMTPHMTDQPKGESGDGANSIWLGGIALIESCNLRSITNESQVKDDKDVFWL